MVRLTDLLDMIIDVDWDVEQTNKKLPSNLMLYPATTVKPV